MNTARLRPLAAVPISLALLLALCLAACQENRPPLAGSGMDMFTPVKMRLHPLSRLTPAAGAGEATLEARLELTDQFDDICKGAGAVYCELFLHNSLGPNQHGDRLQLWNFDLNKPETNKVHWDGITRTYLLKLPLNPGVAAAIKKQSRVILSATWTLPNGGRLSDDITLNLK
jgi:hypothetical protein